jgi:hypothetical protein
MRGEVLRFFDRSIMVAKKERSDSFTLVAQKHDRIGWRGVSFEDAHLVLKRYISAVPQTGRDRFRALLSGFQVIQTNISAP